MVMPLWDENPFNKPVKPWVTWGIIALNVVVFIVEVSYGPNEESFLKTYALTPLALVHPNSVISMFPVDLTLFTYMFLHADIFHLLGNMIFLFVFGDDIEEAMGMLRFVVFYLACGVVGGLVFAASAPQSAVPLIGASGACSGVVMAYLMLRPCAKIKVMFFPFFFRLSAFWVIGIFVATQLYSILSKPDDDVAYWCHIGGLIAGAVLFPLMRRADVQLFECIEGQPAPFGQPSMPDTSRLPGAPREPTIR